MKNIIAFVIFHYEINIFGGYYGYILYTIMKASVI